VNSVEAVGEAEENRISNPRFVVTRIILVQPDRQTAKTVLVYDQTGKRSLLPLNLPFPHPDFRAFGVLIRDDGLNPEFEDCDAVVFTPVKQVTVGEWVLVQDHETRIIAKAFNCTDKEIILDVNGEQCGYPRKGSQYFSHCCWSSSQGDESLPSKR